MALSLVAIFATLRLVDCLLVISIARRGRLGRATSEDAKVGSLKVGFGCIRPIVIDLLEDRRPTLRIEVDGEIGIIPSTACLKVH